MDKPEWKVSGNFDEKEMNKIMEHLQKGSMNFGLNMAMPHSKPNNCELDFKELSDKLENEGSLVDNKSLKAEKAVTKEIVEPFTDIIENPSETVIIMEMCGVDQKNLEISVDADDKKMLFVRAVAPSVIYEKHIPIEHNIEMKNVKGKTKNGIISITIKK
jgi:HSP20 family molecular chaperone IbpA